MKTLEGLRKEMFDNIYQENVLGFKKVFDEFDDIVYSLRAQRKDMAYLAPWCQVYGDLFDLVVPNGLVDFYEIVLATKASAMTTPNIIPPDKLTVIILESFNYILSNYHEDIVIAYIKHLRKLESRYPGFENSLSALPILQLLSSEKYASVVPKVLFECAYNKKELKYLGSKIEVRYV